MPITCPQCRTGNPDTARFCAGCGTPLGEAAAPSQAPMTLTLETRPGRLARGALFAGRYEVIEILGEGGMGEVFRVEDRKLEQDVALKVIRPEIAAQGDTIERFRREVKTARMIAHRNVCRMFDMGEEQGTFFITMEYVAGEDLKSFIRRSGQLAAGTAVRITRQVCRGLAEAHRLGIVHRDLKPSNIMIDKEGNARIMDFGIARSIHTRSITGEGLVIGTPDYMSPEQAAGEDVGPRSDLYSLGVILYEMVTGRVPFEGTTPLSVAMKHKLEAPRDPRDLVPMLTDDLGLVILKCLHKDPEARYRSAEELLRDLDGLEVDTTAEGPLPAKRPPGTAAPAGSAGRIKWAKVAVWGGAGLFLALAIFAKLSHFKGKGEVLDSIAVLPFENASADPDAEYLSDGITESLINRLSQLSVFKKVISRTSSFAYKGKKIDPREVGAELGVKAILTARMVRYGETLSISPSLVRTSDSGQLWGERYKRKFQDIFAIEEEITSAIVTALKLELTGEQKKKIGERRLDNVQAYEFYLKAKREIGFWTKEGCDRARQYLEKGLEAVGDNAMLNAGLGYVYFNYANMAIGGEENGKKAEAFAQKALQMDPESTEAHFVLGLLNSSFFGDQRQGVLHLKKALAANPYDGDILWWLCVTYVLSGKISAAEDMARRMAEFDPLNPQTVPAKINVYHYGGRLDLAFDLITRLSPRDPPGLFDHAWFLIYKRGVKDAEDIVERQFEQSEGNSFRQLYSLLKSAALGDREGFSRGLDPALIFTVRRDPQYSSFMADFYARLGDKEKAIDWLENAVDRGFYNFPYLNEYDPYLAGLRGEPRFQELMKRVRYEWEHFKE